MNRHEEFPEKSWIGQMDSKLLRRMALLRRPHLTSEKLQQCKLLGPTEMLGCWAQRMMYVGQMGSHCCTFCDSGYDFMICPGNDC